MPGRWRSYFQRDTPPGIRTRYSDSGVWHRSQVSYLPCNVRVIISFTAEYRKIELFFFKNEPAMAILKRRYGKRVMTHEQGWINFYLIPFRTMNLVVQIAGSLSKPKKCSVCRYFGCSRAANGKKRSNWAPFVGCWILPAARQVSLPLSSSITPLN